MAYKSKLFIPQLIVIHCSATPPSWDDIDVKDIDRMHRKRHFLMVGYHFFIKRDGTLQEGRPINQRGAHARGHNDNAIGVCMAGGVDEDLKPEDNFTDAQWDMLYGTCSSLLITHPTIYDMCGHRDLPDVAKACPCFDVKAWEETHSSLGQQLAANLARLNETQE